MKPSKLLLLLLCTATSGSYAQQTQLIWSTYYGGTGIDNGYAIAGDQAGNVYLAGNTQSIAAINANGSQPDYGGGTAGGDGYLAKFDSEGLRLWATYYGGTGDDIAYDVETDPFGNVYLAGTTNSDNAISTGGYQPARGGDKDAFLVKFDAAGNRLWATYFGGSGYEEGLSVATDSDGNVFLAGTTNSTGAIASNGFQNTNGGLSDAFLVKFNANGSLLWSTYYGGGGEEKDISIATDLFGYIFLSGSTKSTNTIFFNGFRETQSGDWDGFLVKFNPYGNRDWGTYFGDTGLDVVNGVTTDPHGNCYIVGSTTSSQNIAFGGEDNSINSSGSLEDAFLAKFSAFGEREWATYHGHTTSDLGLGVDTDPDGNVFLAGASSTDWTGYDIMMAKYTPGGQIYCGKHQSSYNSERGYDVLADAYGRVYVVGSTPASVGMSFYGFQTTYGGGGSDAYMVRYTSCHAPVGLDELNEQAVAVYPNPSTGMFVLNTIAGEVSITTATGSRVAFSCSQENGHRVIDLSGLPNGVYILLLTEQEKISYLRMVVQQ